MNEEEKQIIKKVVETMKRTSTIMERENNLLKKKHKETEIIFTSEEIKSWGNSAHIPISKKFIGQRAEVRILKKGVK